MSGDFEIEASEGLARAGILSTDHGDVLTPVFMPVGTRGMVRTIAPWEVEAAGFQILLSNTYHLMLRPGPEAIKNIGGIQRFAGWRGAMLTDSGGFQVMSLGARFDENGVVFKSVYDGSTQRLSPERAVEIQEDFGSDIAMVLDVCTMLPADRDTLAQALTLTVDWARRAKAVWSSPTQALFGIVQGGTDLELRVESAQATADIGFDGYAIGGLAVGEERDLTVETVAVTTSHLPSDRARYLMGVGDPYTIVEAVANGVDMFDCVSPTRLGRHGTALTTSGKVHLRRKENLSDQGPIDIQCGCPTCREMPRSIISHLLRVDEGSAGVLIGVHNLWFMADFMRNIREAIREGTLTELRQQTRDTWSRI
ncbi:MAG: tRNA guanosine(34) transglycosylase Tgt [Acidimicrobiaceae bacterium]|nr:tRNA guanosine(34) transglycosylase Tgt [Acidimicrobiaceae bacterium]